jgi:hypothetical protein
MLIRTRSWILNEVVAAGLWIGLIGSAMNYVVIMANGGMPVRGERSPHGIWIPMTSGTKYQFLGDWVDLPFAMTLGGPFSPGDFLIYAGMVVAGCGIVYGAVKHANDRR